jgi:hypothetical protein
MEDSGRREEASMLNKLKAMWARLWRRRSRRTAEHGFYDQRAASRYRSQQDIESARGESYGGPPSPPSF